jgi:hypothetical protein
MLVIYIHTWSIAEEGAGMETHLEYHSGRRWTSNPPKVLQTKMQDWQPTWSTVEEGVGLATHLEYRIRRCGLETHLEYRRGR